MDEEYNIEEEECKSRFIRSLQECIDKYAYTFNGVMDLRIICEPMDICRRRTVVITDIEWNIKPFEN